MKTLVYLIAAFAMTYMLTACQPGMPVTVSGFYRTTDGSKAGLSTTFVPVAKVLNEK
jgi:hypothetical protein